MKHTSFPTKGEKRKFEKTYSYTPAADQINESNCDKLSIEALQGERGELNSELERVRRLYDDIAEQVTDLQSENQRLTEELKQLQENYEGLKGHCGHLTQINVANMAFDKADEAWRKQHKVEDGEDFIHWFMRLHAVEKDDLRADRERLTKINEELVKALKEIYSEAVSISDRNRKSVIQDIAWNALEPTKPLNHEQS